MTMKLFITMVIIFVTTSVKTIRSGKIPERAVRFLEEDAKIRRQSYNTRVIHDNPLHLNSESSINVDFYPQTMLPKPTAFSQQYFNNYTIKRPQNVEEIYRQRSMKQLLPYPTEVRPIFSHPQQSQSFNVGYSVSFTGNPKQPNVPRLPRAKLENAEIITGFRKDSVRKPIPNSEVNDFIDLKKQKVSGIKPKGKNTFHNYYKDQHEGKKFIGNLAPKTQQYLSYLSEPTTYTHLRPQQVLQNENHRSVPPLPARGSWTNLTPSVEIYHSKEVGFTPEEQLERSKKFDHTGALGNSQDFDYSNALDRPLVMLKDFSGNSLVQEQNQQVPTSFAQNPIVVPSHRNSLPNNYPQEQQSNMFMDTSLLRDPVLTPKGQNVPSNDPRILPISFDTTLLQNFQQKLETQASSEVQQEPSIFPNQQTSISEPEFQESRGMAHVYFYGSTEASPPYLDNKEFNSYFEHFDQVVPQESAHEFMETKPPRHKEKKIKDVNGKRSINKNNKVTIETELRPPPLPKQVTRYRRMFKN